MAHSSTARVAVVNARISDRSLPRYKLFRTILGRILRNVDIFLAQSEEDKNRLIAVGADAARVQVSGNLKFDVTAPKESELVKRLREAIPANAPVIVCGSTVEGEEAMLLTAFKRVLAESSQAVMVLAPRHPERFPLVKSMLSESGLSFWLRSGWNGGPIRRGVLLLDTIGDLASTYALATAAFVGGSLVARGGHNILEPAQFAKPIFVGPYTENFRDIMNIFLRGDAVHVVDPQALGTELAMMLDPKWQAMGERALQVFRSQSGATQRTVDALEVLMWMPSTIKARYQQAQQ
jgi:3-deoxy-D-manno-octulosonic-acid transferase